MTPEETFDYHLESLMDIIRMLAGDNATLTETVRRLESELGFMIEANDIFNRWYDEDQETKMELLVRK